MYDSLSLTVIKVPESKVEEDIVSRGYSTESDAIEPEHAQPQETQGTQEPKFVDQLRPQIEVPFEVETVAVAAAPAVKTESLGPTVPLELQKLIGDDSAVGEVSDPAGYFWIPVDKVDRYENQPRKDSIRSDFNQFKAGIKAEGQQKPCLVMRIGDRYGLIGGERRWTAVKEIGWTHIKAVFAAPRDEFSRFKMAAIDNYNTAENLPLEIAGMVNTFFNSSVYAELSPPDRYLQISKIIGLVPPMCKHYHNLLSVPEEIRRRFEPTTPKEERIGVLVGSFISSVKDQTEQIHLANMVVSAKLSLPQLKEYARKRAKRLGHTIGERQRKPVDDYRLYLTYEGQMRAGRDLLKDMGKERFRAMFRNRTPLERSNHLRAIASHGRWLSELHEILSDFHDAQRENQS